MFYDVNLTAIFQNFPDFFRKTLEPRNDSLINNFLGRLKAWKNVYFRNIWYRLLTSTPLESFSKKNFFLTLDIYFFSSFFLLLWIPNFYSNDNLQFFFANFIPTGQGEQPKGHQQFQGQDNTGQWGRYWYYQGHYTLDKQGPGPALKFW